MLNTYIKTEVDSRGYERKVLRLGKIITHAALTFITFLALMGSFYIVGGTEYAVERTPAGKMIGVTEPGVHFKWPFLSSVHKYDQFHTIAYVDNGNGNDEDFGSLKRINFADTYGGFIGGTIRFQITPDPLKLVEMHKAYLNEDNLIESGLKPVAKQLLAYTANQLTGENFMQGGQNEYQNRVTDQGNNGLFVTKRVKVAVMKNSSDVGLSNENPEKRKEREEFIYINKIQLDEKGEPLRTELPTAQYGIKIAQVTIDDFQPEPKLKEFIDRKKQQIAIRQKLIEEQENERQSAVTAELRGNRERVEAKQAMLREKDSAVIQAQKKVELEQKEADLQVVRKKKELEIAKSNEGIQEANAIAAKHQAQAIEYKGLAEANVKAAMYNAVKKDILELEVEKAIQQAKYAALQSGNVKIEMPQTVMTGGGENGSLQDLTNLHIMDKLDKK